MLVQAIADPTGRIHIPKITIVALPCNGIEPPLLPLATATSCLPLLL